MPVRCQAGLEEFTPYKPGLTAAEAVARFGAPPEKVVKLGSGENPYGPSPAAADAVVNAVAGLHRYPEWTSADLRTTLANHLGVDLAQVVCGAGETELISAIIRAFAGPGDEVLMHHTTFPIYHLYAAAEGRTPVFADSGWASTLDVDDLLARMTDRTRVVFLTTPHNPSGRVVRTADIRRVCAAIPSALVVVDEAYVHFSEQEPAVPLLTEFDNLIVLRTFSKAYGLAGLRVGFGAAAPEVVSALLQIKPTWNLGPLQVAGAVAALGDTEHLQRTTKAVRTLRESAAAEIERLPGFSVVPGSEANFLLVRIDSSATNSREMFARLAARGLIVKDCSVSYLGLGDRYLRIDVGDDNAMTRLLDALGEVR